MAQFTVYKSTDASAPVLTGQTGKLVALLDAILVNGYSGKSAAGWTKPFVNGSTGADFLQGASSRGMYLQVNDDGSTTTSTFQEATIQGFEAMSAWNTLSAGGRFPTSAQVNPAGSLAGGLIVRKSGTADATARAWVCFADSRTFYLLIQSGDTAGVWQFYAFGDIFSLVGSSDTWACGIIGKGVTNTSDATNGTANSPFRAVIAGAPQNNFFLARSYTGVGGSLLAGLAVDNKFAAVAQAIGAGALPFPNSTDGGLYLGPVWAQEGTAGAARGRLRGVYAQQHAIASFTDGDTFSGVGDYAGKTFYIAKSVYTNTAVSGTAVFETSATLESN